MDKLGLEISLIVFTAIFGFSFIFIPDYYYWQQAKEIITEDEKEMVLILIGQMELSNTDFSCDIDFIKSLHDKPICLSKSNVITLTNLGYVLHDFTKVSIMWYDSDGEFVKMKGESGRASEYNGTVTKISIKNNDYYMITNPIFQENKN